MDNAANENYLAKHIENVSLNELSTSTFYDKCVGLN